MGLCLSTSSVYHPYLDCKLSMPSLLIFNTVILFLWSNYILSIRGLLCPTVKPLHQPLLLFVIGDEPTTLRTAATISTDAALGMFIGTFTLFIGVLVGGLLFYCISKHRFHSSKPETSSHQQQQAAVPQQCAGPVYEEVVELKENVAYGPAQGIKLKPCEAYVPVQHWLSLKTFSESTATWALQSSYE